MVFVSRRLARLAVQFFSFLGIMTILYFIANHQTVRNYIPAIATITPLFFQPDLSIYLTDVAITSCLKLNANGPLCGMPDQSWTRVDKDILLGNSWTGKLYLLYHTALKESVEFQIEQDNDQQSSKRNKDAPLKVIIDMAVENPTMDGKINNNVNGIPKHVLKDFHNNKVFDDEEHAALVEANAGNIGDLQTDKDKTASHFMKQAELEKLAKEKEKQAKGKEGEAEKANDINDDKSEEAKKLNELQEDTGRDPNQDKKLADLQKDPERNKEEDKKLADFEKNTNGEQNEVKKLSPEEAIAKRETAKSRHELEVAYTIPTALEIKEKGWVKKTNGIWIKYGDAGNNRAITAIDVLFGADCVDPRPNWQLLKSHGPLLDVKYAAGAEPYLTIRRGKKVDYSKYKRPLKMNKDGTFKVLQVADLHFLTGVGQCRDPVPVETKKGCEADPRTLKFLNKVLDIEKPDFVVLTGDQIFGESAKDSETAVFKALNPFIERKIPFAVTMGNHDDEGSLLRHEVFGLLSLLPYAHGEIGPDEVAGVGNYLVVVQGASLKNPALLFYFLDTHKYLQNPKVHPGYDWLKELQLKWLESTYSHLKKSIASYTKIHLSMAFFHIPLPEYRNMDQPFIGQLPEGITAPKHNTHARDVLHQIGVSAVSCGHDHANDFCLLDTKDEQDKMWMCYGGGSGEGGYGGYGGYVRRLRTFEFDTSAGHIKTWKRREDAPEKPFDHQTIVQDGKVVNFE